MGVISYFGGSGGLALGGSGTGFRHGTFSSNCIGASRETYIGLIAIVLHGSVGENTCKWTGHGVAGNEPDSLLTCSLSLSTLWDVSEGFADLLVILLRANRFCESS